MASSSHRGAEGGVGSILFLRNGAVGERTLLYPVELVGGGCGLGLLLLLVGHAKIVTDAPGDGLADVNRVLHDPLGRGGVVVELALHIGRGSAGHPHLIQGGIHLDILAGAGGDGGQPGENGLASLHTLTAAVKAEHASAGDRAVKGVGVNGHMEIRTEGIGFLALVLHGGHVPHLHGHAAALQGDAAAIRDLAALDGLGGIAVGIAVVGLIAGRQIHFSHCQCRTDGLYLVVIGVTRVGLAVGIICGCGGAKECIGAVLGPAAVYIVLAGSIHSIPLDVGLAGRRPVICLHHWSCTAAGDGHRSAEGGVGSTPYLADGLHLVVIGVSGVGLVIGIICGRGGANVFICAIAAAAAVHLILAGSVHSTPIDIGLAGGGQIVRCHHRSCAAAGDGHCGAEGGVGSTLHLADGLYLVVVGIAGVGLAVGIICGRGGTQKGIGALLAAAAVHLILAGSGHCRPLDVGLAGRRPVICLHHRSRTAAGDGHRSAEGGVGAIGSQSLHLVVIGGTDVSLAVRVVQICGGVQERISAVLAAAAVHLVTVGSVHSAPIDIGLAAGAHIAGLHGGGYQGLFAFAMSVRLQKSVIAVVNRNGIPLPLAAAVVYVSQARAARKSHIPDVGHALRDLDAGQARAAVERIMPDGSRAAADGHTGQARAIL